MIANSSVTRSRDILPMEVADMTFLVNRLGEDCAPLQYVRELTQNAIEALGHLGGAGEVLWDVSWSYYDLAGVFKLSCIDTGIGMTGPEMVQYINKLSSSVHQQSAGGNFGVGAKIAAAPINPHGLVYMSWKNGVGHMIHLWFDPAEKIYGLKRWPQNNGEFWTRVSDDLKPTEIKDHGTVVVLHGRSDEHNTMDPPAGTPMKSRWILRYLNTRYFRFPEGVTVKAREGWEKQDRSDTRHNFLRDVDGQGVWLDKNCQSKGSVELADAHAHWWILKEEIDTDSGHFAPGGHVAALYQNELYELVFGRGGTARLMNFGVIFGTDRVVLYVEPAPTGDRSVTANTARTHLVIDGKALDWAAWAAAFREKLPQEIIDLQEQIGSQSGEKDYRKAIHERLKQIRDLLKFSRFRPAKDGPATTDPTLEAGARSTGGGGEGGGEKKRKGGVAGDIYSLFAESGEAADAVDAFDEPEVKWVTIENGTRVPQDLEDRAARFLPAQNQLVINGDFRVFTDMVERWAQAYPHVPGASATVREVVHEWFQQQLMEAVMSARALRSTGKWSFEELERLWSEEALTSAVLPRWHIDQSVKRSLGQRLGTLKVA